MKTRTGFCQKHPTYQAKHAPKSACDQCRAAFEFELEKHAILADAAKDLSDMLGCDVALEARYRYTLPEGYGFHRVGHEARDVGMRVEVERLK